MPEGSRPRQSVLGGTLAPFLRALDNPMAMACLGSVTFFFDLPPLLSVPSFISCIASLNSSWAFGPYFAMAHCPFRVQVKRSPDTVRTSFSSSKRGAMRMHRDRPHGGCGPESDPTRLAA